MSDQSPTDAILVHEEGQACVDLEKIDDLFSICSPTQAGAFGLLARANSEGVSPAPFLEAFAKELSDFDRIRVQKLAAECRENVPLIEVFESAERFFPSPVILAMRLAHDSGKLEDLCESISNRPIYAPAMKGLSDETPLRRIMSVIWKGLMIFWVTTFVMLFIIPQFQGMFEEFGLELPATTVFLMRVAALFCQFWFVFVALAAMVIFWFRRDLLSYVRRAFSPTLWNQTTHSPVVQAKLNLAWLFESGVEASSGLKQLARFEPNKRMATKIQKAITRTEAGQAPWKALGITRVISDREARVLETASSSGTRSWLLRQIAFAQSTQLESNSAMRVRLFTSLANVVLGLFVLLFCVALFSPLIHIIKSLT